MSRRSSDTDHLAEQRSPQALAAFKGCAARFPEDGLVRLHLQRLRGGGSGVEIRMEQ
jgi:hypothetical protein